MINIGIAEKHKDYKYYAASPTDWNYLGDQ